VESPLGAASHIFTLDYELTHTSRYSHIPRGPATLICYAAL
jgi:hypothetical protein